MHVDDNCIDIPRNFKVRTHVTGGGDFPNTKLFYIPRFPSTNIMFDTTNEYPSSLIQWNLY